MGHSVGKAAENAVKKSEKKSSERNPLEIIADIRKNLASGLGVTPDDQRFLLQKYDDVHALMNQSTRFLQESTESLKTAYAEIDSLKAKLEEFRSVYEAENRSQTLKVEKVLEPGSPEAVATETVAGFEHAVGFARMSGAGSGE